MGMGMGMGMGMEMEINGASNTAALRHQFEDRIELDVEILNGGTIAGGLIALELVRLLGKPSAHQPISPAVNQPSSRHSISLSSSVLQHLLILAKVDSTKAVPGLSKEQ